MLSEIMNSGCAQVCINPSLAILCEIRIEKLKFG